jgi:hypothetical protein
LRPHTNKKFKKKTEKYKNIKKCWKKNKKKDKYISLEEHTRTPRKLPKIG